MCRITLLSRLQCSYYTALLRGYGCDVIQPSYTGYSVWACLRLLAGALTASINSPSSLPSSAPPLYLNEYDSTVVARPPPTSCRICCSDLCFLRSCFLFFFDTNHFTYSCHLALCFQLFFLLRAYCVRHKMATEPTSTTTGNAFASDEQTASTSLSAAQL